MSASTAPVSAVLNLNHLHCLKLGAQVGAISPVGTPTPGSPSSTPPPLCIRELPSSTTQVTGPPTLHPLSSSLNNNYQPLDNYEQLSAVPDGFAPSSAGPFPRPPDPGACQPPALCPVQAVCQPRPVPPTHAPSRLRPSLPHIFRVGAPQ